MTKRTAKKKKESSPRITASVLVERDIRDQITLQAKAEGRGNFSNYMRWLCGQLIEDNVMVIPENLRESLQEIADFEEISFQGVIRNALQEYVDSIDVSPV